MGASRLKRPSSSRRLWTAEEDSLLGTRPDRDLAREFGRTVFAVVTRRQKKRVLISRQWRPEDDRMLGKFCDRQVALLLGRQSGTVSARRLKLGIPATRVPQPWTPEQDRLLGTMPDEELARRIGRTKGAVMVRRYTRHVLQGVVSNPGSGASSRAHPSPRPGKPPAAGSIPGQPSGPKPEPAFKLSQRIRHLRFKDLPLSVRLENILTGLRLKRLGQLHDLPIRHLRSRRNCGLRTLAEVDTLLCRAEAGEFTRSRDRLASEAPAELLRFIDDLVGRLPERSRVSLTRYFGASGAAGQSQRQISERLGLTRSAVGLRISEAFDWMRRQGRPRLQTLLDSVEQVCARTHAELNPALIATWQNPTRPVRHSPLFYFHIIARLRPGRHPKANDE